ncbi:MAG: GNAT family N-acetyltransferase [Rhizomicrobium sp.]|jgi:RimJ/RimL family protein N-acetyltransferase
MAAVTFDIPVLETPRLILRAHRLEDFDERLRISAEPVVTRFFGGKPMPREDVWRRHYGGLGHWAMLGFGMWAVEEKETCAFIGTIGFLDGKRDIVPSLDSMPEMGWLLSGRVHGKGYATEAVRAAQAWGDVHFGKVRTCCIIAPENRASLRVAEKCGFRILQNTTYKDEPIVVLVRD